MRYLLLVLILFLSACTPHEAIMMTFGRHHGPHVVDQAHRIAACESGNGGDFATVNPDAVSPTNDHGMFQINARYHRSNFERVTGQPWHKVYEPFWNAVYAHWLYDQKGWQPWACRKVL